jgi:hypothetical protein
MPPTPVQTARRILERGRRNPRKGCGHLSHAHTGQHRDVKTSRVRLPYHIRPCAAIPAAVSPSRALQHHPQCCGTQDDKTSPRPLLCPLRPSLSCALELVYRRRPNRKLSHSHPRSRSWEGTGLATTPDGSKIRHDGHQLRDVVHHTAIRN